MKPFLPPILLLTSAAFLPAQSLWQPELELAPREGAALTYDPVRGKVVLFGGRTWIDGCNAIDLNDLFEWDGTTWTARHPQSRPPARARAGLAFDPSTGGILLYGGGDYSGCTPTFFQDTWIYDGRDWRDVTPPITPPAVTLPALATDPVRGRVYNFVGNGNSVDVWEWDGVQWQVVPALNPPPRLLAMSAAYNSLTGRISVFSYGTTTVWEWDGVGWHAVLPIGQRPPDMPNRRAAADPTGGGVAVFGGNVANPDGNVWYWNGSSWSIAGTFASPRLRPENVGLAVGTFPGAELVLYVATRDTWTLDVTRSPAPFQKAWTLQRPRVRGFSYSTYDAARDQVVILASDWQAQPAVGTWLHRDGEGYLELPGLQPPGAFPIGFHPPTGQVVGVYYDRSTLTSTTWTLDGAGWTSRHLSPAPSRPGSYAYDPNRQRLLFVSDTNSNGEVWGWDGQAWTLLQPPDPQFPGALSVAFDAGRDRLVAFHYQASLLRSDLWEWDGSSWILANPASGALTQGVGNATYVPSLGGVVAAAGDVNSTPALYRWDGSSWTLVPGTLWPREMANASGGGLHYDSSRNRILALGIFFDLRLEPYSFWQFEIPTLTADQVEPRIGETVTFRAALPGEAGRPWLMGLSLSAWPGIPVRPALPFGFERIPLTPDPLLAASLGAGLFGTLDPQGRGSLRVSLPGNPALTGLPFHAAGITLAPGASLGAITSRVGLRIVQ